MAAAKTAEPGLAQAIVDALRPWKCPEGEVQAAVREAIAAVRQDVKWRLWRHEIGTYRGNKETLEAVLQYVRKASVLLGSVPPAAFWSQDWPEAVTRWFQPTAELIAFLEQAVQDTGGYLPNQRIDKTRAAFVARLLIEDTSGKRPTAGRGDTPFCTVATLLFEAATGVMDENMERACKAALRIAKQL